MTPLPHMISRDSWDTQALLETGQRESNQQLSSAKRNCKQRIPFFNRQYWINIARGPSKYSSFLNLLLPFIPAAIILDYFSKNNYLNFAISFLAILPAVNLYNLAIDHLCMGLEEGTPWKSLVLSNFGGLVEFFQLLFLLLQRPVETTSKTLGPVIQSAIFGAMITNMLVTLGLCFFFSSLSARYHGRKDTSQQFSVDVSEYGIAILLVAAFGLFTPSAFFTALKDASSRNEYTTSTGQVVEVRPGFDTASLNRKVVHISHIISVFLLVTYILVAIYQIDFPTRIENWREAKLPAQEKPPSNVDNGDQPTTKTDDPPKNDSADPPKTESADPPKVENEERMTAIEYCFTGAAFLGLLIYILHVNTKFVDDVLDKIPTSTSPGKTGVPEQFMGLILLPLSQKIPEILVAVYSVWKAKPGENKLDQILQDAINDSKQTALFNCPVLLMVAWGRGSDLNLNFEILLVSALVLSLLIVSTFLRDGKTDWLEAWLCLAVYAMLAVACYFYPSLLSTNATGSDADSGVLAALISSAVADQLKALSLSAASATTTAVPTISTAV